MCRTKTVWLHLFDAARFVAEVSMLVYEFYLWSRMKVECCGKQDPLFEAARKLVIEKRSPSISLVQRTFRINYSRAKALLEAMENEVRVREQNPPVQIDINLNRNIQ